MAHLACDVVAREVYRGFQNASQTAIHVAHAFSIHGDKNDIDYFSAVDHLDCITEIERDYGDASQARLATSLFYGYLVVDMTMMFANIVGSTPTLIDHVIERLLYLIATGKDGIQQKSLRARSPCELLLVEAGNRQPRSLAGAFRHPVSRHSNDVIGVAAKRLSAKLSGLDGELGISERRALFCRDDVTIPGATVVGNIESLLYWARNNVLEDITRDAVKSG